MKYNIKNGNFEMEYNNTEAVSQILLDYNVLKMHFDKLKSNESGYKDSFFYKHSEAYAKHLYVFICVYRRNPNCQVINSQIPEETLRDMGTLVLGYVKMRKHLFDEGAEYELKKYLYSLNKTSDSKRMVIDFCDMLIKKLNASDINTYVSFSKSTNSIYIKPDTGVLKTIRVSDHAGSVNSEFSHKYSIVLKPEDDDFWRRKTTYEYGGEEGIITTVTGANNFEEAIQGVRLALIKEKERKKKQMIDVVYNKMVSRGSDSCYNFERKDSLY